MAKKILNVKFMGDDIDKLLDSVTKEIFADKAAKKKNSIINAGLKESANYLLPHVWNKQRSLTGAMRMFTGLKRLKRGGWRISTPYREELAIMYPKALDSNGYYPASMEYGFKHYKSKEKINGDGALGDAMDAGRSEAIEVSKRFYSVKLDAAMKKYLRKKG